MKNPYSFTRILLILVCGVASPARAALIASERFSYANGNLAGSNGGNGWAGAWSTLGGTPTVANGQAIISATPAVEAVRLLATPFTGNSTAWVYFTGLQSTTLSGTTNSFGGLDLYENNTQRMLFGKFWPGNYEWRAGVTAGSTAASPATSTLNLTKLLIKVSLNATGNDTMQAWLNPSDLSSEASLGVANIFRSDANLNFDRIRLHAGSDAGGTESWAFDDLIIATDLASIPEPSIPFLSGLSVLGLSLRRRR